jgi:hypothetical protein
MKQSQIAALKIALLKSSVSGTATMPDSEIITLAHKHELITADAMSDALEGINPPATSRRRERRPVKEPQPQPQPTPTEQAPNQATLISMLLETFKTPQQLDEARVNELIEQHHDALVVRITEQVIEQLTARLTGA